MKTAVIIPALNPDRRLLELVTRLRALGCAGIVVVDDGSRPDCKRLFERLKQEYGCVVRRHKKNLGKGAALKTGLRSAASLWPGCAGYVTADADGQHSPKDILRVAAALEAHPGSLTLGTRDFSGTDVPIKSRWGNRITSQVFRLGTGVRCPDTQTGLRGIPACFLRESLEISGNRFEYEMNFLLEAARKKLPFVEVPIDTIYLEKNSSSHFHPLRDSVLIYWNILKFSFSSLISAAVDLTVFTLLAKLVFATAASGILAATVLARLLSGSVNFLLNRKWVFASRGRAGGPVAKYLALFCGQMLTSWLLVQLLSTLPVPLTAMKAIVDGGLFLFSYRVQKKYVFPPEAEKELPRRECA